MAREPTIYESAAVGLNGVLITESTDIALQWVDSDEVIMLLGLTINDAPRRGVVVSPGGRYLTVEVGEARKIAGTEIDIHALYLEAAEVSLTLTLLGSGETIVTRGFIKSPSIEIGTGKSLMSRWSFVGYASSFQAA